MELYFLILLFMVMIVALGSGFPVAFALPGASIITIGLAAFTGWALFDDNSAFFIQDGPVEWLTAGVTNFRGIYWEVERDTLIAIPLFIFMGIMLQRSKIAEDLLVTMAKLFGPVPGGAWHLGGGRGCIIGGHDGYCWRHGCGHGFDFSACHDAEQLFPVPGHGHHLRLGHFGANHPTIYCFDHPC